MISYRAFCEYYFYVFQIWDLSDERRQGFLDKDAFFVALKLVSAAQQGLDLSRAVVAIDLPPPRMVAVPDSPSTPMFASAFSDVDWVVQVRF